MQKRLFIAINLPPRLKTELGYLLGELAAIRELKPVHTDQLHLTLAFLGYVDENRILTIKQILDRAATTASLTLTAGTPIIFEHLADFRGIWVPIKLTPELNALADDLRTQLRAAGFSLDPKPFTAHITLARANHRLASDTLQRLLKDWQSSSPLSVDIATSLTLFSSELTPRGSIYTPEHTVQLN